MDKHIEESTEKETKIDIPDFVDLTTYRTEELQKQISEAEDISYIPKEILEHATFDTTFKWPEKLPDGFNPEKIIEEAKNPGLEIHKLHEDGITGKGITVAIIDQKLSESHIEFKDNLISNKEYSPDGMPEIIKEGTSMHGPAVASIFVGKNCGIAPDAKLFYSGIGSTKDSFFGYIKALEDIIEYNKTHNEKIKIVSVSKGHGGREIPGTEEWIKTKQIAKDFGITVIDSNYLLDNLMSRGGTKINKDKFDDYEPSLDNKSMTEQLKTVDKNSDAYKMYQNYLNTVDERVIVPCDYRTLASGKGDGEYRYQSSAGISWSIPYLAGVFALAMQVNPDLTNKIFLEIVHNTVGKTRKGLKVINPEGIIEEVKKMVEEEK